MATASKVSIFYVLHDSIIILCITNSIVGDADALRGPRKSVDVAGCSPRPWAVWYKLNDFYYVYGDVKRKAGVRSTLSAAATRSPVGWVELLIISRR